MAVSEKNPTFFKQVPLIVSVQGNPTLIDFASGFSKSVDLLSGMTVNLMKVMQWQQEFSASVASTDFSSWFEFLVRAFQFFQNSASSEAGQCEAVQARFFDQSLLRFQDQQFSFERRAVAVDSVGELRVLKLKWDVANDLGFEELRDFQIPEQIGVCFRDLKSGSDLALKFPPSQVEVENPQTQTAEILTINPKSRIEPGLGGSLT